MTKGILVVDDEERIVMDVANRARECGIPNVWTAETVKEAFDAWKENKHSIVAVVLDLNIDAVGDGWDLLRTFRKDKAEDADFSVFIYSANFDEALRGKLEAMSAVNFMLVRKSFQEERLWASLGLLADRLAAAPPEYHFSLEEVAEMRDLANSEPPILIIGGRGSGKTVKALKLAKEMACERSRIFLINCASLTRELAETELFGSMLGAFTGAVTGAGKMMIASGFSDADLVNSAKKPMAVSSKGYPAFAPESKRWGAVILDEIGSLDPVVQAKLLLVIEGEPMQPLGWRNAGFLPNCRIIGITNEVDKLASGTMRKDLFARFSRFIIECKDLRDEPDSKIRRVIEDTSFPTRVRGVRGPRARPALTKQAVAEILERKGELRGNYRDLNAIIERAWIGSRREARAAGPVEIDVDDVRAAWKPKVEICADGETVARPSPAEVEQVRSAIADALGFGSKPLNRTTLTKHLREGDVEVKKNKIREAVGLEEATNDEKGLIWTRFGLALGFPEKQGKEAGTAGYADSVSENFSSMCSQAKKKTGMESSGAEP